MNITKVNQATGRVLDGIWLGTASTEIDLDRPGFQHFHAERLVANVLAISHTFIQNGDLMRDPEIVFFRACEGVWYPLNCTQDPTGSYTDCASHDATQITEFRPRAMRGVADLANIWLKNLRAQFPEIAALVKRAS